MPIECQKVRVCAACETGERLAIEEGFEPDGDEVGSVERNAALRHDSAVGDVWRVTNDGLTVEAS